MSMPNKIADKLMAQVGISEGYFYARIPELNIIVGDFLDFDELIDETISEVEYYAEEYFSDLAKYRGAPNRKDHEPILQAFMNLSFDERREVIIWGDANFIL